LDGINGVHLQQTDRDGEIPMICKRFLFMLYNDVISCASDVTSQDCYVLKGKSYKEIKNSNTEYKKKKNELFKTLGIKKLGHYPKMDDQVDYFVLDFETQ